MPGQGFAALPDIAHDQYGYVTVAEARRLGLAEATLRTLAYRGDADRVAHRRLTLYAAHRPPTVPGIFAGRPKSRPARHPTC